MYNSTDMFEFLQIDDQFQRCLEKDDRPDKRWLLVGNERSGSKWHKDPNRTSAINGVLYGRKKWWMLPPDCPPPGVFWSPDGAEVAQPVSLFEWLLQYHHEYAIGNDQTRRLRQEGICHENEIVFVPRGWWHAVINLDDWTIAVTENFVTKAILQEVRHFLHYKVDQISGVPCEKRPLMA